MTTPTGQTPEAIVGLTLDGRGFQQANSLLREHEESWGRVEGITNRIATHVGNMSTRIAGLAGGLGVGLLVNDFLRLEDAAARASLAMNIVGPNASTYRDVRNQVRGAAISTFQDPVALTQAVGALAGVVGQSYFTRHPHTGPGQVAQALGLYSTAYGLNPQQLATQIGGLELYQGQNAGATGGLLAQITGQAQAAGMAGQTGQFIGTVAQVGQSLIATSPRSGSPATGLNVGALYAQAQSGNQAFRDPSLFGSGLMGIQGGIQGAYANPRLQAAFQMMGIGYWDQRAGFAGPHGRNMAHKILAWADKMYGHGSVAEDLFLRTNFGGTVGADLLQAFADGHISADQLTHPDTAGATRRAHQREHMFGQTPGAKLQQRRAQAGQGVSGPLGDVMDFFTGLPWEAQLALGVGGLGVLGKGVGAAMRLPGRLARGLLGRGATTAGAEVGADAAARTLARAAGVETATTAAGATAGRAGILGLLSRLPTAGAGLPLLPLDIAGAYFSGDLSQYAGDDFTQAGGDAGAISEAINLLKRQFGPRWYLSHQAHVFAQRNFYANEKVKNALERIFKLAASSKTPAGRAGIGTSSLLHNPGALLGLGASAVGGLLGGLFGGGHGHDPHGGGLPGLLGQLLGGHPAAKHPAHQEASDKFAKAVKQFEDAVKRLTGGRRGDASFNGSAGGTTFAGLNASGAQGGNDAIGATMLMARFLGSSSSGGGSSSSGGAQPASDTTGGGGGSTPGMPHTSGGHYSIGGLVALALRAGFRGANAAIAAAVAMAESSGDPHSTNTEGNSPPSRDRGLWQINSYWNRNISDKCAYNPSCAASAAFRIWKSRGWRDWVTYTNGAYRQYLAAAQREVDRQSAGGGRRKKSSHGGGSGGGGAANPNAQTAGASGGGGGGGGDSAALRSWLTGSDGGGSASDGGGGAATINVHVDGRKLESYRALTRGRV